MCAAICWHGGATRRAQGLGIVLSCACLLDVHVHVCYPVWHACGTQLSQFHACRAAVKTQSDCTSATSAHHQRPSPTRYSQEQYKLALLPSAVQVSCMYCFLCSAPFTATLDACANRCRCGTLSASRCLEDIVLANPARCLNSGRDYL